MRKSTIAIVLLLMLAIPFQGFAAAIQSGCALGHHRANTSATTLHKHDGHDHHHAAMHAPAAMDEADTDSDTGATTECKCSACGLGTGLPVSRTDTTLTLPAAAPLGRFVYLPVIMITGGPERPPRNILA
jgi:hypothetical protein